MLFQLHTVLFLTFQNFSCFSYYDHYSRKNESRRSL